MTLIPTSKSTALLEPWHSEKAAGGYASNDGTVEFYQRVVAVCPPAATVLDLGAGRGVAFDIPPTEWKGHLLRLGGKCRHRVGADIDDAILTNRNVDEAHLLRPNATLPFADESFDLVLCDWVLEHIEEAEIFLSEVRRVLKTGGWLCARTPNKWSYFAIGARILPNFLETYILGKLQPTRESKDVFPKHYRLNSLRTLKRLLIPSLWLNASYGYNPEPAYYGNSRWLYYAISLYQKLTPRPLRTTILIFAQRLC